MVQCCTFYKSCDSIKTQKQVCKQNVNLNMLKCPNALKIYMYQTPSLVLVESLTMSHSPTAFNPINITISTVYKICNLQSGNTSTCTSPYIMSQGILYQITSVASKLSCFILLWQFTGWQSIFLRCALILFLFKYCLQTSFLMTQKSILNWQYICSPWCQIKQLNFEWGSKNS